MSSTVGRLLVAPPALRDPNFTEAVVFVLTHNDEGAFGHVLNRPSEVPVGTVLPAWEDRCTWPANVFSGGPVQLNAAVGLVRVTGPTEGVAVALGDLGTVDLERDPTLMPAITDLRVVEHLFETDYHRPTNVVKPGIELGGAADDVEFLSALVRWFGDPKKVRGRP